MSHSPQRGERTDDYLATPSDGPVAVASLFGTTANSNISPEFTVTSQNAINQSLSVTQDGTRIVFGAKKVAGNGPDAIFGVNLDGISANTTRALSNSWVATNTPSIEALTEFTVETNGFKAEYGAARRVRIGEVERRQTPSPT